MELDTIKISFILLESFAFILPAIPESLWIRLTILFIYFIAHYFKIQGIYVKFKNQYIKKESVL